MAGFSRFRSAYEEKLKEAMDLVIADLEPGPAERDQIVLLNRLFLGVLDAFSAHQLDAGSALDVNTSVMYAAAAQAEPAVLNVTLSGLVDYNSLNIWQARTLTNLIGSRRTVLITGPAQAGKSTLLNALVQLLPRDGQVVVVEEKPELPILKSRPFTLTLQAKPGTPAATAAFARAAAARPSCVVAGQLALADALSFLQALNSTFGLATLASPDPEMSLAEWQANAAEVDALLMKAKPTFAHVERDQAGRPRLGRILETRLQAGRVRLVEIRSG